MRRPWKHQDELEARLRASRPEPRPEFLHAVARGLEPKRRAGTLRIALAAGFSIAGLVMFGTFGGIGYASSAAHSFVTAIAAGKGASHAAKANRVRPASSATAASNQYARKTTICHRTHSAKNPFVVITVSNNALPAHKAHGDTLVGTGGKCPGPAIP